MNIGRRVIDQELVDVFKPNDGTINMYYGRIGHGKTYAATADILDLLRRGKVVYCNWKIDFSGFDERDSLLYSLVRLMFFRKRFYRFKKDNLRYFAPDDVDVTFLANLTDCDVFIDEGQWIFDSGEGSHFAKEKRKLILHTRHLNRSLNIVSQRTQAVQITARAQVNRFYRCVKKLTWPVLVFQRSEFQDMKNNDVDEDVDPISKRVYIASKRVLNAYDTKYLRAGVLASQKVEFEAYDLNFRQRLGLVIINVIRLFRRSEEAGGIKPPPTPSARET